MLNKFNEEVKKVKEFNNNTISHYVAVEIAKISFKQEVVKVAKLKETKTEMALRIAKERNITTHREAVALMQELDINSGMVYNKLKAELKLGTSKTEEKKQEAKNLRADTWQMNKDDIIKLINSGSNDKLCWNIYRERKHLMNGVSFKPLFERTYN